MGYAASGWEREGEFARIELAINLHYYYYGNPDRLGARAASVRGSTKTIKKQFRISGGGGVWIELMASLWNFHRPL